MYPVASGCRQVVHQTPQAQKDLSQPGLAPNFQGAGFGLMLRTAPVLAGGVCCVFFSCISGQSRFRYFEEMPPQGGMLTKRANMA